MVILAAVNDLKAVATGSVVCLVALARLVCPDALLAELPVKVYSDLISELV